MNSANEDTADPPTAGGCCCPQLFVDSFLVDETQSHDIATVYHQPVYRDDVNPVLRATERWERGFNASGAHDPAMDFATPYSGGLFWDPTADHYKFWYSCGTPNALASGVACLATSRVRPIRTSMPALDFHPWQRPLRDMSMYALTCSCER
jgi:hypothetical protein|eukprot:COSAG06_NODE_15745_length_1048_cov_1.114858_2_plen_151_part_00